MNKLILGFLFVLMLSSYTQKNPYAERVSIINLIATPEKFNNKSITVKGYYSYQFENARLYLDEISAKNNLYENSITVILDSSIDDKMMKTKDNKYIQVEGHFKMAPLNNKSSYGNSIQKIYNIDEL